MEIFIITLVLVFVYCFFSWKAICYQNEEHNKTCEQIDRINNKLDEIIRKTND